MLTFYQNIPSRLDPIAIAVGSFSIDWYGLMYLVAFAVIFLLLLYRIKKKEGQYQKETILDLMLFSIFGALIGGRLGYVLFYNPGYYLSRPLEIISPYDFSAGEWIGIYGMSYHGGLLGMVLAIFIFAKLNPRLNGFWRLADFVIPAISAGYFFGRLGNFLNGELYGRITESPIGMYFPTATDGGIFLRYPSQLMEAFLEGIVLFVILWSIRNRPKFVGYFSALYLIGYGFFRFIGELFREPDEQIGFIWGYLSLGQVFSAIMILAGVIIYFQRRKKMI